LSYYRAALASAAAGDLTGAARLVNCSVLLGEDAPSNIYLSELLKRQNRIDSDSLNRLRTLSDARRYRRALRVNLPQSSRAHTIRGLLYAQTGRLRKARKEFTLALTLDTGNGLAKQALPYCKKRGFFS